MGALLEAIGSMPSSFPSLALGEHTLPNGRRYRLVDTGTYISGEYPSGGIVIHTWEPRLNQGKGMWAYIDNSPDEETAKGFLRLASALNPLPN